MMMQTDLVNIIFGMKIRQARQASNLSLSAFARQCELSPSYITEIEKGRKYPKADKILKMAEVLNKDYDDLVSIRLDSSMQSLETMLNAPLLRQFPFEEFGVEVSNLMNLFTRAPKRASALVQAILAIGRLYDMKGEHFLRAALRSYQEIHDNYFQDLEDAAFKFAQRYKLDNQMPLSFNTLKSIISQKFGYELDMEQLAGHPKLSHYRSVYVKGHPPKLLLNSALQPSQVKFLLARELGYQYLKLKQRANTSAPDTVESFEQVLNDFKASYFAGAILLPQTAMLNDLKQFFELKTWQPQYLLDMLTNYEVTPEMLLYRFSELIPQFFGIKPHFLRFNNAQGEYQLVKQLNVDKFFIPSGLALDEHLCRHWLAVRLLKESSQQTDNNPLVGVQLSEFFETQTRVLSFGFARPLALSPDVGSSVTVGLIINSAVQQTVQFLNDPKIPFAIINETCERCPLTAEQCKLRAGSPTIYEAEQYQQQRQSALKQLLAELQS